MTRTPTVYSLSLALCLAACGGGGGSTGDDDDGDDTKGDDLGGVDAGPDDGAACAARSSFGALGTVGETATRGNQPGSMGTKKVYALLAPGIDAGPPTDDLMIQMWDGFGAFSAGAVTTGDFELTGDDADPGACGACVYVLGDVTDDVAAEAYIATAGTLHVTSIAGNLTGSLEGATFTRFDPADGTLDASCTSSITSASFDHALVDTGGGGSGGGNGGGGGN
jgi:hypothetical protein